MGTPSAHPKSIILDYCWACGARFVSEGGTETRHDHHLVPRAYGGADGPTVTLCTKDHTKLHAIAVSMKANKPYFMQLTGETQQTKQRLMYMANVVYNSELATRNDPNKAAQACVTLNQKHKAMIDRLKQATNSRSREAVLLAALEHLYNRKFPH
jgi:hypothetical protein